MPALRLSRDPPLLPAEARGAAVALGNFDGLHLGHQVLLREVTAQARRLGAAPGVVTFEPHPRRFFAPDSEPFRLTTLRTKVRLLRQAGVERVFALRFDAALAAREPEDFAEGILGRELGVRHVAVGADFRFGRRRRGDVDLLARCGARAGYSVGVVPLQHIASAGGDSLVSSSAIRQALREGRPREATRLLSRPWEIEGAVRHGAKRGRALGYPTANIALPGLLRPAYGVYAVRVAGDGFDRPADGVPNLGISPMFSYAEPLLEVHLFDFAGDLYGRHLRVSLIDYLRGELRFDTLDELVEQMHEDSRQARQALAVPD